MIGQCKFDGIYFVFFSPRAKTKETLTHIAHIGKAPQPVPIFREANATTKALSKSAILLSHHLNFFIFVTCGIRMI